MRSSLLPTRSLQNLAFGKRARTEPPAMAAGNTAPLRIVIRAEATSQASLPSLKVRFQPGVDQDFSVDELCNPLGATPRALRRPHGLMMPALDRNLVLQLSVLLLP